MIFACLNKNDFPSLIVACSERNASPCLGRAPQSASHFSTPLLQRSSQIMASMMWLRLVMARLVLNMCMLWLYQLVCMFAPQGVCDSIHLFLHQLRCRWRNPTFFMFVPELVCKVYVTQWQPFSAPVQGNLNPQTVQEKLQVHSHQIPTQVSIKFPS